MLLGAAVLIMVGPGQIGQIGQTGTGPGICARQSFTAPARCCAGPIATSMFKANGYCA